MVKVCQYFVDIYPSCKYIGKILSFLTYKHNSQQIYKDEIKNLKEGDYITFDACFADAYNEYEQYYSVKLKNIEEVIKDIEISNDIPIHMQDCYWNSKN